MIKKVAVLVAVLMTLSGARMSTPAAVTHSGDTTFFNDLVITLLEPSITGAVSDYYRDRFVETPGYSPSMSTITQVRRPGGGRSCHFLVDVEVKPYFGPHLTVGKDRLVCEVRFGQEAKVLEFEHLEDHELPEHYQQMYR